MHLKSYAVNDTAAAYPNIRHFICRPIKGDVANDLRDATRQHFLPLLAADADVLFLEIDALVAEQLLRPGAIGAKHLGVDFDVRHLQRLQYIRIEVWPPCAIVNLPLGGERAPSR